MNNKGYQLTIDKIISSAALRTPGQIITYQGKEDYTYEEFYERVKRLASSLVRIGVKKGDIVAVIDWDTNRYLESYYAIPMAGAVIHTVNIRYPPELIFYTMQHAGDTYVIIRDEFVPIIEKNKSAFSFIKGWIVYSEDGEVKDKLSPLYDYDDLVSKEAEDNLPELNEDDLATTFYTSGTTGMPKGVSFTHRQIVLHTLGTAVSFNEFPLSVTSKDVLMPLVPMFHVHSWGFPYSGIMKGMKYVLPGKYDYPRLARIIKEQGVTVSAMVPSILYMIMNVPDVQNFVGKDKFRVIIGGSALPRGLAMKAKELGMEVSAGYGLSETAPVLTLATFNQDVLRMSDDEKFEVSLKTGLPIALVHLMVIDSEGNEVPKDGKSIGEIVVRAPWLTKQYTKDPAGTEKLWKNGWMHTGDLAVVDDLGYISIVDREKDAVKSGGEFIPSLVLEDVISTCEGVKEVAVVAKPDEKWGERPVAFYSGDETVTEEKIREHLDSYVEFGRIAKFWVPDEFRRVGEFQKTSTGKIDKKVLKEILAQ
ncbi:long-chain fatty acid--CoA ligase [uncultured archaeon]|nr:long-chain fatty acid--CoA ligase [uncultured archaeon]